MTDLQPITSPPPPPQWQTLQVATGNLLNLAAPGHRFYDSADLAAANGILLAVSLRAVDSTTPAPRSADRSGGSTGTTVTALTCLWWPTAPPRRRVRSDSPTLRSRGE